MRYLIREVYYLIIKLILIIKYKHIKLEYGAKATVKTVFEGYNKMAHHSYLSGEIGYGSYIGARSVVIGKIGRYCCIAEGVTFLVKTHPVRAFVSTHPCFYSLKKQSGFTYVKKQEFDEQPVIDNGEYSIIVGNDVYIGYGTTIIGPRKIGDGAIIAANSVVTHDIEPYTIVAGNPAKIVRKRFDDDTINHLNKIKWWEKDTNWLLDNAEYFKDINLFMSKMK